MVRTPLPPGPGEATVSYLFGATSHTLMHVNVIWATAPAPTASDRAAIAAAGLQLSNYFRTQPWDPKTPVRAPRPDRQRFGHPDVRPTDAKGGNVQVEADNTRCRATSTARPSPTRRSKGGAVCDVSYDQDAAHPDVFAIKPGAF